MNNSIMEKVSNFDLFHCVNREGFIFTSIIDPVNVFDAIVVRNPEYSKAWSPKKAVSNHTLNEHIEIINKYNLEKAVIICENLNFIVRCPSLKYLEILPADTALDNFDYSPLYKMPEIKYLSCRTSYGGNNEPLSTSIDYSKINGLKEIAISGEGNLNYHRVKSLERLSISNSRIVNFTSFLNCKNLKKLNLFNSGLKTLDGIECFQNLQQLNIEYDRTLCEISSLEKVANSLRSLSIEHCAKLIDFSVIYKLSNLEHLDLHGNNKIPDLKFLNNMPKLKTFTFSIEVQNGDLTPCLSVPYVWSVKNRKEYNFKDKELPKNQPIKPFEII